MRDAHRMKEKLDLSLDNRQVVSLVMAGLVVLGMVFVLGVVVGKKLSSSERSTEAPDLLTALDEKAAALDGATTKGASPLTFQDELTKKSSEPSQLPPRVEPPPRVAELSVKTPEAHFIHEADREGEEPEVDAPPPPPPVAVKPAEPAPLKAKPDSVLPARTATHDAGGLKEAIARAQRPSETAANGAFTLQISASQDRGEADKFIARLKDKGYAPYLVEAQVAGKGTWYRVRMGRFPSKEAASRYLQDFHRETQLDAFVTGGN